MKRFEFWLSVVCSLAASVAIAATGSSPEFKLDLRGLGPWQRHTASASEALTYSSAWATNAASGAKAVVKVMSVLKTKPKYLVIDLSGGTNATNYGISYLDEVPGGAWSDEYKTSKLVLRHISAGSFIMGGRATDYPGAVNTNLHMVTITRDFYMGVFEVTQRQWELVMGTRPSIFSNETCYATRPVDSVTYQSVRGSAKGCSWPNSKDADDLSFVTRIRQRTGISARRMVLRRARRPSRTSARSHFPNRVRCVRSRTMNKVWRAMRRARHSRSTMRSRWWARWRGSGIRGTAWSTWIWNSRGTRS